MLRGLRGGAWRLRGFLLLLGILLLSSMYATLSVSLHVSQGMKNLLTNIKSLELLFLIIAILVVLFNIFLLIFPQIVLGAARDGLLLWFNNVLPSLLPFMVATNMLIMLGGLQSIDSTLYEAAYIDGSNRIKNMFYITIPHLMPVIWFCLIMSTIGTFNAFVPSVVLFKNGGPGYATYTMTFYQYRQTFQNFRLGYGAALAFAIMIFIAVSSIPQVTRAIKDR
jgi:ABC-type glycerol-3-phosphate transport system permease component